MSFVKQLPVFLFFFFFFFDNAIDKTATATARIGAPPPLPYTSNQAWRTSSAQKRGSTLLAATRLLGPCGLPISATSIFFFFFHTPSHNHSQL